MISSFWNTLVSRGTYPLMTSFNCSRVRVTLSKVALGLALNLAILEMRHLNLGSVLGLIPVCLISWCGAKQITCIQLLDTLHLNLSPTIGSTLQGSHFTFLVILIDELILLILNLDHYKYGRPLNSNLDHLGRIGIFFK